MKKSDFNYNLPEQLIAQLPLKNRVDSRLLVLDSKQQSYQDDYFSSFINTLNKGDLLVLNDTKVIPARLFGNKQTGGKVELLLERITDDNTVVCFMRASKSPKTGSFLQFKQVKAEVVGRQGQYFLIKFINISDPMEVFFEQGHIPLPPYIERPDDENDLSRYQTVFAKHEGAVAAPTAGLHFDDALLQKIKEKGVTIKKVTLHVGSGTFQPVREDDLSNHIMHKEWVQVTQQVADAVNATHKNNKRVVAVGTTVVRSLESASKNGQCSAYQGDTDIFITPGYQFNVIDALLTNFHLPESTLMMLVSAMAGHSLIMDAYQHAVEQQYRFFSYGDAMLIMNHLRENNEI